MDKPVLVSAELAKGAKILEILDRANLNISVALWLHASEYEDWRFVLSSPRLDRAKPAEAYGLIHDALEAEGFPLEHTPALLILKMGDPFTRALRKMFGKSLSVDGMRLGGQLIGDRFVEDALVYRIR
jgi:hypothetical protein